MPSQRMIMSWDRTHLSDWILMLIPVDLIQCLSTGVEIPLRDVLETQGEHFLLPQLLGGVLSGI